MGKRKRKNGGITLIALVVTVVVLMILAGISIGALTGENGLINQAQKGKEETEIAEEKEVLNICTVKAAENNIYGNIEQEELQKELDLETGKENTEVTDIGEEFEVYFKNSNRYYFVDKDGIVEGPEKIVEDKNPGDITKDEEGKELDGSEEKPFEIWCIEDLVVFSNMVNGEGIKFENGEKVEITKAENFSGKYVKLKRTLNFKSSIYYIDSKRTDFGDINGNTEDGNSLITEMTTGSGFIAIGYENEFKGIFDGENNKILSLYENSEKRCGLFGQTNQAIIKNITVDGNITSTKETAAGIAVVSIATTIENCTNYATINTTNENPSYLSDGGITFTNSYSGGIVGRLETDSSVNNCINYGTIRTKKTYAAGIAGFCQGKVNNCVNYGDIYSEGSAAAGIGGFKYNGSETGTIIMNCCNYGNISSTFVTGGIWGHQIAGKVSIYNCFNLGNLDGKGDVTGGIYGKTYGTTTTIITNCYNGGHINGKNYEGGIIGSNNGGSITITNSFYIDNVDKAIGNGSYQNATKYSKDNIDNVMNELNNYIKNNSELTKEWKTWTIDDNNIVFQ